MFFVLFYWHEGQTLGMNEMILLFFPILLSSPSSSFSNLSFFSLFYYSFFANINTSLFSNKEKEVNEKRYTNKYCKEKMDCKNDEKGWKLWFEVCCQQWSLSSFLSLYFFLHFFFFLSPSRVLSQKSVSMKGWQKEWTKRSSFFTSFFLPQLVLS